MDVVAWFFSCACWDGLCGGGSSDEDDDDDVEDDDGLVNLGGRSIERRIR